MAASSVVRDLYEKILRRDRPVPQARLVLFSRIMVVLLVGAAVVVGLVAQELVFWLVLFAWAGLGASFGPTSILALYWRGTTRAGVIAGLITGTAVTFIWERIPALSASLYELIPAFFAGALATVVVSRLTRPPEAVAEKFDAMKRRGKATR